MKAVILLAAFTTASATMHLHAQPAFIKLLKGPEEPAMQRVAFVGEALVRETTGKVERLTGIERWTPLEENEHLRPGDVMRVADGSAILQMTESRSFVRVTPYTVLRLAPLQADWDRAVLTGEEEQTGFAVRSSRGEAFCREDAASQWRPLLVNTVLPPTAEIRTGEGAVVDLYEIEERKVHRIRGATAMQLSKIAAHEIPASLASVTR